MAATTASDESTDDSHTSNRQSGILDSGVLDTAEREASLVASAVDIGMKRDDEFDIDTDDGAAHASPVRPAASLASTPSVVGAPSADTPRLADAAAPATLAPAAASVPATEAIGDDAVIEVGDDEIVTAEPDQPRQTLPSPSASVLRSRPPAPPSVRPRSPASSQRAWLPPPQHLSSAPPPVGPASSRPAGVDPWVLANRTLELSRANARVADLLEQVAFRDARIAQLEERLERMQRKLDALESEPVRAHANAPNQASPSQAQPWHPNGMQGKPVESELVVTQTRAIVDVEQSLSSRDAARLDDDDDLDPHDANGSSAEADERESDFGARTVARGTEEDLQQISGIGPRFEAALRRQGITRLSQIAAWSDADVRQVAKALRIPKSRIVKGRWIEVAREVIGTRLASE